MKLGSLFDGSGGFPLAGVINGAVDVLRRISKDGKEGKNENGD